MNIFLHSLLVIKGMNDFTVTEARDALLEEQNKFIDKTETRKFIYRQLYRNVGKGLLKRTEQLDDGSKKITYSKTEKLLNSIIFPIKRNSKSKKQPILKEQLVAHGESYKRELKKDLVTYEIDLNTTLEEVKEYKRLLGRFPELKDELEHHRSAAKAKSIKLLGKVHALQNLLGN